MLIKFQTLSNSEDTATLKQHIFKAKQCKERYTLGPYSGNISLCNRVWSSEDGEHAMDFEKMDNEPFNEYNCCKHCIKQANKLGINLQKLMLVK